MTAPNGLRTLPAGDRVWLMAALADALAGGPPIVPVDGELDGDNPLTDADLLPGTAVVIRTSGSSGIPKSVALSADALRASAAATLERLGGPGQWLVALPAHLVSGLQMLVRSEIAKQQPVFLDGRFDAAEFFDAAQKLDGDRAYVSLVPVQLRRLLDFAATSREAQESLAAFDAVLVGGQTVPLELRRRAHDLGVELRRSYGMTETAGGCVYDGVELGTTRIRIRAGEVQIAGPTLALGYVGDAALTSERFIAESDPDGTPTRWYRTGDAGELLGGMLHVTGRIDRVIVSGGINVSLDLVEQHANEHHGSAVVHAVGVADPEWGERVHLVIDGAGEDPRLSEERFESLQSSLRETLGVAALPTGWTGVSNLPRLAGGKPDYRTLTQLVASATDSSAIPASEDTV